MFYYNVSMSLLRQFLFRLGLLPGSRSHYYELDETQYIALESLARREQRPASQVAAELVTSGLIQHLSQEELVTLWGSLSPREQEVAALACLGYTNRQIAAKLGISDETVKTHLRNALLKFKLHSRSELHMLLAEWDFSAWDPQRQVI